jgi:tRNA threonylcarbamoyl adenosine modification protein YeaZ
MLSPLLAFDCSFGSCSVAVGSEETVLAEEEASEEEDVSARLVMHIAQAMKKSWQTARDLKGILTTCGPGSFTGVRTGLAVAQGLRLALKIPVYVISSLEALFLSTSFSPSLSEQKKTVLVTAPSHREWIYLQPFSLAGKSLASPQLICLQDIVHQEFLENVCCVGIRTKSIEELWYRYVPSTVPFIRSTLRARLLLHYAQRLNMVEQNVPLEPIFVKKTF